MIREIKLFRYLYTLLKDLFESKVEWRWFNLITIRF